MIFLIRGEVHRDSVARKDKKENMTVEPGKYEHQRDTLSVLIEGRSKKKKMAEAMPMKNYD